MPSKKRHGPEDPIKLFTGDPSPDVFRGSTPSSLAPLPPGPFRDDSRALSHISHRPHPCWVRNPGSRGRSGSTGRSPEPLPERPPSPAPGS